MRRGTVFAAICCLAVCSMPATGLARAAMSNADSLRSPAPADTVFAFPVEDSLDAYDDTPVAVPPGVLWPGTSRQRRQGAMAEMATYKSLWEMLSFSPHLRWTGSGGLGGVESISIRGNAMRRAGAVADGAAAGPDYNMFSPGNVDSAGLLSGFSMLEEVVLDGAAAFEVLTCARARERQEGHLSLSRGFFLSRFNSFSFTRSDPSYWFGLKLDGASFGRAASYEAYTRDEVSLGWGYIHGSGVNMGVRARKFKSKSTRYTGDKTKTSAGSVLASAGRRKDDVLSWKARAYYSGDEYSYLENGPEVEDDLWAVGGAVDLWPAGVEGAHRLSAGVRRENLERSVATFYVPEELTGFGTPDEGAERSIDAAAAYSLRFLETEDYHGAAIIRVDHKDLFGWKPSWYARLGRSLGAAGEIGIEGGRSVFMPRFLDIYAPRDEAARPTWFFAQEMEPETEWSLSGRWSFTDGVWDVSAGGFGSAKEHVLAPTAEWLGMNKGQIPTVAAPVEDLGDGSAAGVWAEVSRSWGRTFKAGGSYSALRTRAGGEPVPFTPGQKAVLWVWGERGYFGDDMKIGIVLRGALYSRQATLLDFEFPSYGLADALGYVTVSDIVFFYQLKNLETRSRPSAVLDVPSGEYFLQPEPEVRFGLVWYLPG